MDDAIHDAASRFYAAANAVVRGDAGPMLALWSSREDVTYAAPNGEVVHGAKSLRTYWERAAELNRATPGTVSATGEILVLHDHGSTAYTVTIEHLSVTEGNQVRRLRARASHVYRLEDGGWRLLHRHAEPPVPDVTPSTLPSEAAT